MRRRTGSAKGIALFTTGLIIVLSTAVPMLEAAVVTGSVALEAAHGTQCQVPDHDHSICVQHAQQRWIAGSSTSPAAPPASVHEASATATSVPSPLQWRTHQESRAPPLV